MFGLYAAIDELLLEVKNPEEKKKLLKYKYKNIPEDIINALVDIDTTKKGSFSEWVLKTETDFDVISQNIENGNLEKLCEYLKDKQAQGFDLQKYTSLSDALEAVGLGEVSPKNDYKVVYDSPTWRICIPNTYEASRNLGAGTRWCTASSSPNYYNNYTSNGDLYINFDKRTTEEDIDGVLRPYTRYQFHFPTHQFMDIHDYQIELYDIDMPKEVLDFYKSIGFDEDSFENDEVRQERYDRQRLDAGIHLWDDFYLLSEYNYEYDFDENDVWYAVFNISDDERDPVSHEWYRKDNVEYINKIEHFAIVDDSIIVGYDNGNGGMSIGNAKIEEYALCENNQSVLYITDHSEVYWFKDGFEYGIYPPKKIDNTSQIVYNEELSRETGFLLYELIGDTHTLISLNDFTDNEDPCIKMIIEHDTPINTLFELSEDGKIHAMFGVYDLDGTMEKASWKYEQPLNNKEFYLISREQHIILNKTTVTYNITRKNELTPILPQDFKKISLDLSTRNGTLVIESLKGKYFWFDLKTCKRITDEYKFMQYGNNCMAMANELTDLFISNGNGIYGPFSKLLSNTPKNNMIDVADKQGRKCKVNLLNGQIVYPEMETVRESFNRHMQKIADADKLRLNDKL